LKHVALNTFVPFLLDHLCRDIPAHHSTEVNLIEVNIPNLKSLKVVLFYCVDKLRKVVVVRGSEFRILDTEADFKLRREGNHAEALLEVNEFLNLA